MLSVSGGRRVWVRLKCAPTVSTSDLAFRLSAAINAALDLRRYLCCRLAWSAAVATAVWSILASVARSDVLIIAALNRHLFLPHTAEFNRWKDIKIIHY